MNKCTCETEYGEYEHTCPFSEEINGDSESLCTCCEYCTHQCAQDI
jgi:hypothetical protein